MKFGNRDQLTDAASRRQGVEDCVAGIPIVNGLLGVTIPMQGLEVWDPDILLQDRFADPDAYYAQLLGGLFGSRIEAPSDLAGMVTRYRALVPAAEDIQRAFPHVLELAARTEEEIVAEAARAFRFIDIDLKSVFDRSGFAFVKLNHGYWEEITFLALEAAGKPLVRNLGRAALHAARIDDLILASLMRVHEEVLARGTAPGSFCALDVAFGLSFNNGDYPSTKDLATPLVPVIKGAMIGSLAFFKAFFPAEQWVVADGCEAKQLVWRFECEDFFERVTALSDAVVFIVPTHLRRMDIKNWDGPTFVITIPAQYVQEMWPAVLPSAAGALERVFRQFKRITILAQLSLLSVPLGVLVHLMGARHPNTIVRFFDMGQMLDIATYPGTAVGPWMKQPELQPILLRSGQFPVFVRDDSEVKDAATLLPSNSR